MLGRHGGGCDRLEPLPVLGRPGTAWAHAQKNMRSERGLDAWRYAQAKQAGLRLASSTATASDPVLQEHYASDRVICQLEVDLASRVWGYQQTYLCSDACLSPLAVIFNVLCCPTAYLCLPCCFPAYERKVAAAHRLVLRERTLLVEVDEHFGMSSLTSSPALECGGTEVPVFCEPGGPCPASLCGTRIGAHSATIRLADVAEIALESGTADAQACTDQLCANAYQRAPDQLVVTNAAGIVVAAIAGPKDAQGFIDRVQSQKQRVLAESLDEDAPAPSVPLTGPSATDFGMSSGMGGMSGMDGMGGMGGILGGMGGTTMMSVAPQQHTMQRSPEPPIISGTVVTPAAAGGGGLTEKLVKLSQMRQAGELTDEEFAQAKRQLLGGAN